MTNISSPIMLSGPLTPPYPSGSPTMTKEISSVVTAIHVMSTERAALAHLEHLYQTNTRAQQDLARAVDQIARSVQNAGKLVICGVGKSGKIGRKIEATMNSLGIYSAFLHPTEALHGDLGLIRPNDTILLISFSGRSPELLTLLPHIPLTVPIIALSSHTEPASCPLLSLHGPMGLGILLQAPIHEEEEASLGVSAPTSSTTVALCLGDALAIAAARKLHTAPGKGPADVFRNHHPGGAIGAAAMATTPASSTFSPPTNSPSSTSSFSLAWDDIVSGASIPPLTLLPSSDNGRIPSTILVPFNQIPTAAPSTKNDIRLLDLLLTAIQHPNAKSWAFLSPDQIIPPRRILSFLSRKTNVDMLLSDALINDSGPPLAVPSSKWFAVPELTPLTELRHLVSVSRAGSDPISVIAVMKDMTDNICLGFIEAEDLWGE
ncbi:hypothetical protein N7495_004145 [Penicillium taxi]|uniref:uncharacterized protein n=1 Tax=Penicillium taxi TaxID=168475 RepID=UPI0025454D0D|nr:uncharacterized protein N7495_004145 [Penicillium taxi]KAJ5899401.1 hypothetical protein N7495_004145 [Penicillium taxi]